ncbi:MAG: spore coat protein [Oscillospiraceae bacterium]|jgi:spore coat protein CotF|nr:spore coat protein [Oscillospiraceae bacterium]
MNQFPNSSQHTQGFQAGDQGKAWNDEAMIGDILTTEKALVGYYAAMSVETTCQQLRQVLTDNYTKVLGDQYQVFDLMKQRNWYPVKNAPAQEIQDAKTKFSGMRASIPQ